MPSWVFRTIVIGTLLSAACDEPTAAAPASDQAAQRSVVPPVPAPQIEPEPEALPEQAVEPAPPPAPTPPPPRDPLLAPTPFGTDSRPPGDPNAVNDAYAVPGDPINDMATPRGNSISEMDPAPSNNSISDMATPRGNSISEMDAEPERKDGGDPISGEPPQPPVK